MMSRVDTIKNLVMDLLQKQNEDGYFFPFSQEFYNEYPIASLQAFSQLKSPESKKIVSYIFGVIFWHTDKVVEVFCKKINPVSKCGSKAEEWCKKYQQWKKAYLGIKGISEEEIIKRLESRSFGRLIVTTVDPILHTLLLHLDLFRRDERTKKIIAERILENIMFPDYTDDPSNLFWALVEWTKEKKIFNEAFREITKKIEWYPSFNKLLDIALLKVVIEPGVKANNKRVIDPAPIPEIDATPEIYGIARSTAYGFINLSQLIELGVKDKNIKKKRLQLFKWIEENEDKFNTNPYLLALLIECYYHHEIGKDNGNDKSDIQKLVNNTEQEFIASKKPKQRFPFEDFIAKVIGYTTAAIIKSP